MRKIRRKFNKDKVEKKRKKMEEKRERKKERKWSFVSSSSIENIGEGFATVANLFFLKM